MKNAAEFLADYGRRRRGVWLMTAATAGLAVFLLWMLVACLVDRFAPLPAAVRVVSLLAATGAAALILIRSVRQVLRFRATDHAAVIERQFPSLQERLITLASATDRASQQMLAKLELDFIEWRAGNPTPRPARQRLLLNCGSVVLLVCVTILLGRSNRLQMSRLMERFASPLTPLPAVGVVVWDVLPGDMALPQGTGLKVAAKLSEPVNGALLNLSNDGGKSWHTQPMHGGAGKTFELTIPSADDDLRYYVSAGRLASPVYTVQLLRRPGVAEFRVRLTYPPAMHRSPVTTVNTDGIIEGAAGAEVSVDFVCTEPMSQVVMIRGNEHIASRPTSDDHVRRITFTLRKDGKYELQLRSEPGVTASRTGLQIKVTAATDLPGFEDALKAYRQRSLPTTNPR